MKNNVDLLCQSAGASELSYLQVSQAGLPQAQVLVGSCNAIAEMDSDIGTGHTWPSAAAAAGPRCASDQ